MRLPDTPVLFVGAHCDDIELFAGGLASKLGRQKRKQHWLTFSAHEGVTDHVAAYNEHRNNAAKLNLKTDVVKTYNAVDGTFQAKRQEIYDAILRTVSAHQIGLVVTHPEDTNQDHAQVLEECRRCLKGRVSFISGEYPLNQLHGRLPDIFVELTHEDIACKVDMIQMYVSQRAAHRHYFAGDMWFGLARMRGAQIGVEYAEAFYSERLILR